MSAEQDGQRRRDRYDPDRLPGAVLESTFVAAALVVAPRCAGGRRRPGNEHLAPAFAREHERRLREACRLSGPQSGAVYQPEERTFAPIVVTSSPLFEAALDEADGNQFGSFL
jgi:hypothetical protein